MDGNKLLAGIDIVEELRKVDDFSIFIIAGGAVRDFVLDKQINDIDIYTNTPISNFSKITTHFSNIYGPIEHKFLFNKYMTKSVSTIKLPNSLSIDIIYSKSIITDINTFDIGLCHIYLNNNYELVMTDEFKKDRDDQSLTLYPSRLSHSQILRSLTYHLPKLIEKYPDYEVRVDYEQDT